MQKLYQKLQLVILCITNYVDWFTAKEEYCEYYIIFENFSRMFKIVRITFIATWYCSNEVNLPSRPGGRELVGGAYARDFSHLAHFL